MEYHKGILAYGTDEIHISGGKLVVRVKGTGLELRSMDPTQLLITGQILSLDFT
jgi:sporulation protein YqfC